VPAEPTAPDVRALIAEMREVADRVFGQNAPLGPLLALQLSTWASRLEAALSSSSGTPRETLREEEWDLLETALARTASVSRMYPMSTRASVPFMDLLDKLRRLRSQAGPASDLGTETLSHDPACCYCLVCRRLTGRGVPDGGSGSKVHLHGGSPDE
jgi:hypothetical protein